MVREQKINHINLVKVNYIQNCTESKIKNKRQITTKDKDKRKRKEKDTQQ